MHKTIISGNVTRDGGTLRRTQGGDDVLGFSIGVSNGKDKSGNWRDKTFFDCSLWGKRAAALEQYITGGKSLTVIGRIGAREHNGKAYLQLSVDEISFNQPFEGEGQRNQGSVQQGHAAGPMEDSIPFAPEVHI